MSFKDQLQRDVAAFLNHDEFATMHTIDDREMWVVVESSQIGKHIYNAHTPSYAEGVSVAQIILYVDPVELGYLPEEDQWMKFDNERYQVTGVKDEDGLYVITLEANTT